MDVTMRRGFARPADRQTLLSIRDDRRISTREANPEDYGRTDVVSRPQRRQPRHGPESHDRVRRRRGVLQDIQ